MANKIGRMELDRKFYFISFQSRPGLINFDILTLDVCKVDTRNVVKIDRKGRGGGDKK